MSSARPRGSSQILRTVTALVLLAVGLVTLNLGLQALSAGDLPTAILYFSVVALSLGFVSFSFLRIRRGYSISFMSNSRILSVVLCSQCTFKQIKNFAQGDFIFKQEGKCSQCGNPSLFINGIYSEDLKKH